MWACYVDKDMEKDLRKRNLERKKTTDWVAHTKSLEPIRKEMKNQNFHDPETGHLRMIIGYNARTDELAISDSCGEWAAERWITVEEAMAITQNDLAIIKW
ncbi:MAG: hypothetical protein PHD76_00050 [Methylacidiphilales bacterium]|nr:hypothetical protein [Candidatus Methylacidiphilales bacterium]